MARNDHLSCVFLIVIYSAFFYASDLINSQIDYGYTVLFQIALLMFLVQYSLFIQFRTFAYLQIAAIVLNSYAGVIYLLYVNDMAGDDLYNRMEIIYSYLHYLLITLDVVALLGAAIGLYRYDCAN